jgi:hypothetical protein
MWEPQPLATLRASTSCIGITLSFTLPYLKDKINQFAMNSTIILSGVRLNPLGTAGTTSKLYQPQIIDGGDCIAIGGRKIGRENRNTWRKPAPAPLCPSQIPHDWTRGQTRDAVVGSQ